MIIDDIEVFNVFKVIANMRKVKSGYLFIVSLFFLFTACSTSPEKYFDVAVLNTNSINTFASDAMTRRLVQANTKYEAVEPDQNLENPASKIIETQVMIVEKNLTAIRELKETDETKEMLQTSIALHEYVLPVYKNEYMTLARECDKGKPKEVLEIMAADIDRKYAGKFEELFNRLTVLGKEYAGKHDINVTWDQ